MVDNVRVFFDNWKIHHCLSQMVQGEDGSVLLVVLSEKKERCETIV